MNKNKGIITLVGFLLAGVGFLALILKVVGLQLSYLTWIDGPGPLFGFAIRILMIVTGIVMIVLVQSDFKGEDQ